ncbi:hypothetical protein BGW38_000451 [Lunasporangiospora selenospora]|uniref:Uncharacterized protein n=1 Tax=Lunasporangiospora selenospora TaxID=979761 RepID=A0A9P6KET4_9FUNG|nr:hypothetical protein BGW38_000451 [Lunasporangiospora selenospora]
MNETTALGATSTLATTSAPKSGHMTKKQRKEHFDALGALQTQLDVSVSLARTKVASWLNTDGLSDDEDDKARAQGRPGSFASASEMKARQPGLGLGAKYISHKDQMRHVPLNAFESKLKRQLTGGKVAADLKRYEEADKNATPDKYKEHKLMMAAKRKELQLLAEEEEDSRTRNVGGKASVTESTSKERAATPNESRPQKNGTTTSAGHSSSQQQHHTHQRHDKGSEHNGHQPKSKHHQKPTAKYQAAVHPAALKAPQLGSHTISASPTDQANASPTSASAPSSTPAPSSTKETPSKKRPGDFFSMYMDERAEKMAKKKKKTQAKRDPDADDD